MRKKLDNALNSRWTNGGAGALGLGAIAAGVALVAGSAQGAYDPTAAATGVALTGAGLAAGTLPALARLVTRTSPAAEGQSNGDTVSVGLVILAMAAAAAAITLRWG